MSKKILILGDCASSGLNVLTKEVLGYHTTVDYGLWWKNQYYDEVIKWYLGRNKSRSIDDQTQLEVSARAYLLEQERAHSYWQFVSHPVINQSKVGATPYGYYLRLKKFEDEHGGRPDFIFVTDHTPSHNWQRVNHKGKKYYIEKNYDERTPEFRNNRLLRAPEIVQEIAWSKAKSYHEKGTLIRRNNRVMSWFLKHLEQSNYHFGKIKFYHGLDDFDNAPDVVDCSDLVSAYTTSDNADITSIKVEVAPSIAKRIIAKYPWLTHQ